MGKKLEDLIKNELRRIGNKLCAGDDSEIVLWVIPGELACSSRPLRYHPDRRFCGRPPRLPPEARDEVVKWVDRVKRSVGIRSIICLLDHGEFGRYSTLKLVPGGLLGFYRNQGFCVCHLPLPDPLYLKTKTSEEGCHGQRNCKLSRHRLWQLSTNFRSQC